MDISSVFGNRIKALRGNRSLAEVAKEIGTNAQTLGRYEKGERKPDIEILQRIADYYNVSADFLLGREPKAKDQELFVKIQEYTGLSEGALQTLTTYKEFPLDARLDTMNALLENADFTHLLGLITEKISIEADTLSISHAGLHTQATNIDVIDYAASNLLKKITDDLRESIPKEKTQNGKFLAKWKKANKG